ncbi:MAG: hypothetical protein H0X46_05500 [Bacteroidetes bacterium]|nr:hypothetical protein [Bacteroidota bacterium]
MIPTQNGWWQEFRNDSTYVYRGQYSNGKKEGYWIYFYPNGKIQKQGDFINGNMTSWWQEYNEQGNLIYEGQYSNGIKYGYSKSYKNGILQSEGKYISGRQRGTWKYYDELGKMMKIQEHD